MDEANDRGADVVDGTKLAKKAATPDTDYVTLKEIRKDFYWALQARLARHVAEVNPESTQPVREAQKLANGLVSALLSLAVELDVDAGTMLAVSQAALACHGSEDPEDRKRLAALLETVIRDHGPPGRKNARSS